MSMVVGFFAAGLMSLLVAVAAAFGGYPNNWEVHPVGEFEHECVEVVE